MNNPVASPPIKLPAVLDFAAAETFLHMLAGCVQQDSDVRIDASEVRVLTFSCVQIMLGAMKDCGDRLTIERPSEEFLRTFNELALDALLEPSLVKTAGSDKFLDWVPPLDAGAAPAPAVPSEPAFAVQEPVAQELSAESSAVEAVSIDVPVVDVAPADEMLPAPAPAAEAAAGDDFEEAVMSKRILTIDDSRTIRDMLMLTLSGSGFNVSQAVDGQEGIDILEKETFDVVITDINMPKKDGYDVIRAMRANPAHKGIPILVLTTEADTEKRQIAREAGATGWMVKPFDPERLVATVRKVAP